jgi:hypothetical protein
MALEAAKQMADEHRTVVSFTITDTVIRAPIPIPSSAEGIETELYLRTDEGTGKDSSRFKFKLCANMSGDWIESCRGTVQVDYESRPDEIDCGKQSDAMLSYYRRMFNKERRLCDKSLSAENAYAYMESIGLCYGQDFQVLDQISYSHHGTSIGRVRVFQQETLDTFQIPIIHPITLDALLHLNVISVSQGAEKIMPAMMPTRVGKLWISNSGINFPSRKSVDVFAQSAMTGYRKAEALLFALDQETESLLLLLENTEATSVATTSASTEGQRLQYRMCYGMAFKPDLNLMNSQELLKYCESARPEVESKADLFYDVGIFILVSMWEALQGPDDETSVDRQPHLLRYVQWLRDQLFRFESGQMPYLPYDSATWRLLKEDPDSRAHLYTRIQDNELAKFYIRICRNLREILLGHIEPLAFMFENDQIAEFYKNANQDMTNTKPFIKYLQALCHNDPNLKVIEIGAGTGATTHHVVDAFTTKRTDGADTFNCAQYDYTDISPAFFDAASKIFACQGNRMKFRVLDIERDPVSQGFDEGTYDVVVAAYVSICIPCFILNFLS